MNNMEREKLVLEAIAQLPNEVINALTETGASSATIEAVAMANRRNSAKRASNRTTDAVRRKTISARLQGEEAAYYRDLAARSGRSVYQFVRDAISREAEKTVRDLERSGQITFEEYMGLMGQRPRL